MKNKETLEEAAEKLADIPKHLTGQIYKWSAQDRLLYNTFIDGAKWQQEPEQFFNDDRVKTLEKSIEYLLKRQKTMYSEEEVLDHLNHLIMMSSSKLDEFTNDEEMVTMKWFEKFGKRYEGIEIAK